jgi:2-polyprenyl-3-methyl-5-hydroxy-6-metoxy-1,4-benzoquinol methylase/DNA-binding transcriptional ArsR family regulator
MQLSKDASNVNNTKKRLIEFWDRYSEQQAEYTKSSLETNGWVAAKMQLLCPNMKNMKIADIGTGAGFMAISLAELGHTVIATDISEKMLEVAGSIAAERNLSIEFVKDDIEDTKLPKGAFDIVVLRDVVYNVTNLEKVAYNIVELIRPGGYLMIADGNYFLYCNDDEYQHRNDYHIVRNRECEYQTMTQMSDVQYRELESIISKLEVNYECRPFKDLNTLARLGIGNLSIACEDFDDYMKLTENGWMKLPFRYSIVGQKPYDHPHFAELMKVYSNDMFLKDGVSHEAMGKIFESLSNPDRIKIVQILNDGSSNVRNISEKLGLSEKMTSYHLNSMKDIGLVKSEKCGREVVYSHTDMVAVTNLLKIAHDFVSHQQ